MDRVKLTPALYFPSHLSKPSFPSVLFQYTFILMQPRSLKSAVSFPRRAGWSPAAKCIQVKNITLFVLYKIHTKPYFTESGKVRKTDTIL